MVAKLPCYKTRCFKCKKYSFIKAKWRYCLACWEKENGKYEGEDRELYVKAAA